MNHNQQDEAPIIQKLYLFEILNKLSIKINKGTEIYYTCKVSNEQNFLMYGKTLTDIIG